MTPQLPSQLSSSGAAIATGANTVLGAPSAGDQVAMERWMQHQHFLAMENYFAQMRMQAQGSIALPPLHMQMQFQPPQSQQQHPHQHQHISSEQQHPQQQYPLSPVHPTPSGMLPSDSQVPPSLAAYAATNPSTSLPHHYPRQSWPYHGISGLPPGPIPPAVAAHPYLNGMSMAPPGPPPVPPPGLGLSPALHPSLRNSTLGSGSVTTPSIASNGVMTSIMDSGTGAGRDGSTSGRAGHTRDTCATTHGFLTDKDAFGLPFSRMPMTSPTVSSLGRQQSAQMSAAEQVTPLQKQAPGQPHPQPGSISVVPAAASSATEGVGQQSNAQAQTNLDVYAAVYIPAWLKDVNRAEKYTMLRLDGTDHSRDGASETGKGRVGGMGAGAAFDPESYASWFLPKHLLEDKDGGWLLDGVDVQSEGQASEDGKETSDAEAAEGQVELQPLDRDAWLPSHGLGGIVDSALDAALEEDTRDTESASSAAAKQEEEKGADWGRSVGAVPAVTPAMAENGSGEGAQTVDAEASRDAPRVVSITAGGPEGKRTDSASGTPIRVPPLTSKTYADHFLSLLQMESAAKTAQLDRHAMYRVKLARYRLKQPASVGLKEHDPALSNLFVLNIPGLREEQPKLRIGDLLHLRPILYEQRYWFETVFEARVWALKAVAGQAIIQCHRLEDTLERWRCTLETPPASATNQSFARKAGQNAIAVGTKEQVEFNVVFINSQKELGDAHVSLCRIGDILKQERSAKKAGRHSEAADVCRRWLFPDESDLKLLDMQLRSDGVGQAGGSANGGASAFRTKMLNSTAKGTARVNGAAVQAESRSKMQYVDTLLNEEQKEAVDYLCSQHPKLPYLISGPPGTGKTKTICEATLQIVSLQPQACVLLCAPSDTAADTVALRLSSTLKPSQLLRINSSTRTFAEVPEELIMFCHIVDADGVSAFSLPPWHQLMKARVIVTATSDVPLLLRARCSNIDLQRLGKLINTGLHPHDPERTETPLHWTHLLVDEAGQGTEAELAAAIACVLPLPSSKTAPVFCLCGDAAQLGPRITSHEARSHGLDWSLFERLLQRKVYAQSLRSVRTRQKFHDSGNKAKGSAASSVEWSRASKLVCGLRRNYRSAHPALLMVPSALFYHDALLPCAPRKDNLNAWIGLPNPKIPLLFENVESPDVWVDEGVSWHNPGEADKIVALIQSLTGKVEGPPGLPTSGATVLPQEIAVITPYREQVWRLRLRLRAKGLSQVNVGHVEVFQGAEHRVTIVSTVRSRQRFVKSDVERGVGLMFDRKRLCVATTRAKEALIVVGNARLLSKDPYWREYVSFALRNGFYRGPECDVDPYSGSNISSLEAKASSLNGDAHSNMIAGRVVAAALFDDEE
ncbi:P-loop containing nucleoside triphosphate hydrolase protein [Tilletiaria anomala UBC 951]|uniref:p-loop containing nucleoside triphosphate hydrolase protein n=1 Tax=Tilletiaria anomala (strain ATCC 24038 / CBS 436.72 / UBC 951) TaxID=1037660 RepID=A0A066VJY6_TILAU|nr:P-loop containing nucleoside triphosphate hydrolase protein [Tilletiaria anomala UBC 951]KDN41776.1 P-loop containing nucleoside triphosphate hydrolase protein [Tilletiaria anomala UBC 951]